MRSAVEQIADFADSARPKHLRSDARQLFKPNILDGLGCSIAGLQGKPFHALREQFEEYGAPGLCTLIGAGKTSADQAALINSSLVRNVDLLDSYMAMGTIVTQVTTLGRSLQQPKLAGASGGEFMLALAVANEIQCRFTAAVPVIARFSIMRPNLPAGAVKLFGLSAGEIANVIAIAKVDNVSLACFGPRRPRRSPK